MRKAVGLAAQRLESGSAPGPDLAAHGRDPDFCSLESHAQTRHITYLWGLCATRPLSMRPDNIKTFRIYLPIVTSAHVRQIRYHRFPITTSYARDGSQLPRTRRWWRLETDGPLHLDSRTFGRAHPFLPRRLGSFRLQSRWLAKIGS